MPSVQQFLNNAFEDAGVIQPGQTASGPMIEVARQRHQDMVLAWCDNRLRLFYVPEATYQLQANVGTYEIGPGAAQFDTDTGPFVKPVFVQAARVLVGTAKRWPLGILTRPEWDLDNSKTLAAPDGPDDLFYDFNEPIATINVSPKPGGAQTLWISQWNPLRTFTPDEFTLDVQSFYPSAYIKPMRQGLAIELRQTYGRQPDQVLLGLFQESIGRLEQINNDKLSGVFSFARTLDGPTKGDGTSVATAGQQ